MYVYNVVRTFYLLLISDWWRNYVYAWITPSDIVLYRDYYLEIPDSNFS